MMRLLAYFAALDRLYQQQAVCLFLISGMGQPY
jgi:hypothetical protein